jgi:hypothetical protein
MGVVFIPRHSLSFGCAGLVCWASACSSEALDAAPTTPPTAAPTTTSTATAGEGRIVAVHAPDSGSASAEVTPQPNYPAGPYGTARGATIANLSFMGWRDPAAAGYTRDKFETLRLSDFYNPDKSPQGARVLVLNASAVWCSVCRVEYTHLMRDQVYANYRPKGIEILGVLFEDNDGLPARPQDLELWGGSNGFSVTFPLVLDPGFKTGVYFASDATPLNMIIDTSNMTILDITMGFDARTPEAYWGGIEAWISK